MYVADAFTNRAYHGNPAGICILEKEMPDSWMQQVAMEMNLSETAFLREQNEGYKLRWFTPEAEVDLCGHATLASAHILWEQGYSDSKVLSFYTKSGQLTATKDGEWITMD